MNIRSILSIAALSILAIVSCKKELKHEQKSVSAPNGVNDQQKLPNAFFEASVQTFYKTTPVTFTNKSYSIVTGDTYEWHLKRTNFDSIISRQKNLTGFQFTIVEPKVLISLIAKNKFGTDTFTQTIKVLDKPKYARFTKITIDSIPFVNPATGNNWNATTGPNVSYKILTIDYLRVDSLSIQANSAANLGDFGWAGNGSPLASDLVITNLQTTPKNWNAPRTAKYLQFNSMMEEHMMFIYNKNDLGGLDLMGTIKFRLIDFFRNTTYPPNNPSNPDVLKVPIRSADGKIKLIIDLQFLT